MPDTPLDRFADAVTAVVCDWDAPCDARRRRLLDLLAAALRREVDEATVGLREELAIERERSASYLDLTYQDR